MPAIDRHRHLAADHQHQRERTDDLVAWRVAHGQQELQSGNPPRWRDAVSDQRAMQCLQLQRLERLGLDAPQQIRQQAQVVRRSVDAGGHPPDARAPIDAITDCTASHSTRCRIVT